MNPYNHITERIISLLEQGTVPWHKPWTASIGMPRNLVSKKPYRGINVFMLMSMRYESPFWLTFRQAQGLGGSVRKREKACPVVFWKPIKVENSKTKEELKIPLLRLYHVFNLSQCEGLSQMPAKEETPMSSDMPSEIVGKMPNPPVIKHGMTGAFYSPSRDEIGMPDPGRFKNEAVYYATLFHELIHSTGHLSRLNRSTLVENTGFGSERYSREELIAELGSAFLCAHAEIVDFTIDSSAAYIQTWIQKLRDDRTLVVQAAAQAQKAADYVLDLKNIPGDEVRS
jgi:antirestriction protein ArdC